MKKEELREKVLAIDPNEMYYADYSIDNEGTKIKGSVALKGEDLTENQIITCESVK